MKRHRFAFFVGAALALAALFASGNTAGANENPTGGVQMTRGGYYGRLVAIRKQRTARPTDDVKASSVTPINPSVVEPIDSVPGRFSVYNVGTGGFSCLARVITVTRGVRDWHDFRVTTDPGDPSHFEVTTWGTRATLQLWEDVNGDGFINHGDKLRRRTSLNTSRAWARRHMWLARQKDIVVRGEGTVTPPPATGYPKGTVVSVNKRAGFTMTRIDYTVGTTTASFNYPNVPFDSWAYESFPSWYSATITEKVTFNDTATATKSVVAPASATADASVTIFDAATQP